MGSDEELRDFLRNNAQEKSKLQYARELKEISLKKAIWDVTVIKKVFEAVSNEKVTNFQAAHLMNMAANLLGVLSKFAEGMELLSFANIKEANISREEIFKEVESFSFIDIVGIEPNFFTAFPHLKPNADSSGLKESLRNAGIILPKDKID